MSVLRLVLIGLVLGLAGCAAVPEPDTDRREAAFEERRAALETMTNWRASGRAGITTPDESVALSMEWSQVDDAYRLDMRGPMGAGSFRLQGDDQGVILRTSDGGTETAADAAELLRRYTGLDLPVEVLPWWLRGLPAPGPEVVAMELDEQGRVQRLEQAGWEVTYDGYDARGGAVDLPVRLDLQGPGISLRAHIRSWETDGPEI